MDIWYNLESKEDSSDLIKLFDKQTEFRLNLIGEEVFLVDGNPINLMNNDEDYFPSDLAEYAGLEWKDFFINETMFLEKFEMAIIDWDGSKKDILSQPYISKKRVKSIIKENYSVAPKQS